MNNAFMEVVRFTQGLTKEDVLMKDLRTVEKEVREEMKDNGEFSMIAKFYNTMTIEDVYGTVEHIDAEVVGVVDRDIEIVNKEDIVDIGFYGTSYATTGIRYTESIESPFIRKMY